MPTIKLKTVIKAEIKTVFDLSTSIDLHKISTAKTKEIAIDGKTSGLITMNEFVTWKATHFGVSQKLTSKITSFNRPFHFRDEQQKGIFKFMVHDHTFEEQSDKVIMIDVFNYKSPLGFFGKIADQLFLFKYLTNLLVERNNIIKEFAESEKWKTVLL